jgi:hypothetical protein
MMPADPHRHLDDEALNAVLDGEASEEERAGAAACADCSARLDRLRLVAAALAAPGPSPDATRRRAAIDAALRAGEPVAAALPFRRRRWPVSPAWAVAAAVVAAGALAVPLVDDLAGRGQGRDQATAARDTAEQSAGDVADATPGEEFLADQEASPTDEDGRSGRSAAAAAHDLGAIDLADLDELTASIQRQPQQDPPRDLSAPGAAPAAEAARPDAGESGGDRATAGTQPCEDAARQRDGALGPVTYAAGATVDGRPAVVLAFEALPPDAPPALRLLVLAADGCAELGSASS